VSAGNTASNGDYSNYEVLSILNTDRQTKEDYFTIFSQQIDTKYRYIAIQIIDSAPTPLEVGDILVYGI